MDEEELIPQEILDKFLGSDTGKKIFRVKGKDMVAYAKAIGETRPEYIEPGVKEDGKPDYSNIIGHPALPAMWTISAMMGVDDANFINDEGQKVKLDINYAKLLHTGQEYDYTDCVQVKDGDKLTTVGTLAECFIKGSPGKEILWLCR